MFQSTATSGGYSSEIITRVEEENSVVVKD